MLAIFGRERLLSHSDSNLTFDLDFSDVNNMFLRETGTPCDDSDWSPMLHVQRFTVHFVGQENVTVWAQSLLHRNARLTKGRNRPTIHMIHLPHPKLHRPPPFHPATWRSHAVPCEYTKKVMPFSKIAVSPLFSGKQGRTKSEWIVWPTCLREREVMSSLFIFNFHVKPQLQGAIA